MRFRLLLVLAGALASAGLPHALAPSPRWPSFRGPLASGVLDGADLPDRWNVTDGTSIGWKVPLPGRAHSSPVVWDDLVFVTTAVSSQAGATFRRGLYGDGDASPDRSVHEWQLIALDLKTGAVRWSRVAFKGEPREKRHIKSTYANQTPATDGRTVVAFFGSQGLYAYDMTGALKWKADLGVLNAGAYDLPEYEWGNASSPIIDDGRVIVQCDVHGRSFVQAFDLETGKSLWRTERTELPSWATPTVVPGPQGKELVTNAPNRIRAYDPATGRELWTLGGSSKITAPTPILARNLVIVASGRAPERPIFAVKPGSRGDLTLAKDATSSDAIPWSRPGRGSYMPTPLAYGGILYVLANNGVLDAYDLKTGREIYRQRLALVGSGFSASPVAADGKIYLSNEDGDMLVVRAGSRFEHLATNSIGELLMATPALSEGVMYVRGASSVFAIGNKK